MRGGEGTVMFVMLCLISGDDWTIYFICCLALTQVLAW